MSLAAFSFTDRAAPFVELGLGDTRVDVGVARWDESHWDDPTDATWAGSQPLWLDISCDCFETTYVYGRRRSSDRFAPGTAVIVASNESGWADPGLQEPQLLDLRPGRSIRGGLDHVTFGRLVLWRGIIDRIVPRYDAEQGDVVDIEAICAMAEVGRVELPRLANPVGANELAGTRINRILNHARWRTGGAFRRIEQTGVQMLATDLDGQTADLLAQVADSTGGAVYGDTEGRVVFRGRDWQTWSAQTPPDATIGNVDASDVCPSAWDVPSARVDILTRILLARQGIDDTPTEWIDEIGERYYGGETHKATDLICATATDRNRLGARLRRTRSYKNLPRIERVYLDAATSDAALDLMCTVDVFAPSRYRCRHHKPDRVVFDKQMLATGVEHRMSADQWQVDIDLDDAAPWQAEAGRWDEALWDRNTWSGLAPLQGVA